MKSIKRALPLFLVLIGVVLVVRPANAAANAVIQNDSSHISSFTGTYSIVGEVLNTGDKWLGSIKITATMKDTNGKVVDVQSTYALPPEGGLPPRAKAPFECMEFDNTKSSQITSYTLALEYDEASPVENMLLVQSQSASTSVLGFYDVVGEVKNNGEVISKSTQIVGTFYDSAGKVIYVAFVFTSPTDIPPGQAYGFKLTVFDAVISTKISHYSLFAESNQYTSVPETPWPVVVMTAALTVAVVALRRKS